MTGAVELAARVREGHTTAREAAEAALAAIAEHDGALHAFLHVDADGARATADRVDAQVADGRDPGPLAGVPVALKDNLCTRGVPTTAASRILEGWVPPYTATVVERLVAAGAIPVGKTNLDEFAMGSSTENSAFGPTRNPHDHSRVPGGSSGGSAAAVAAGMVPLGLGSDTGGSIRQPAALCGVVGVKPTYGAVSRYGLIAFASSLDQIGPLAATVADAAVCLEVLAGHDPCDSTSLDEPAPRLTEALDDGVAGRRVGLVRELVDGAAADVAAAVHRAAAALEAAGASVVELSVPEVRLGLSAYYLIAPAEASSNLARYDGVRYGLRVDADDLPAMNVATRTRGFGDEVKRRVMLGTYALSAGYYDAVLRPCPARPHAARARVRGVPMSAATCCSGRPRPPPRSSSVPRPPTPWRCTSRTSSRSRRTSRVSPRSRSRSAPGDDGLPVGVQLLGPARAEPRLFAAARVLEAAA